MLSTRTSMTLLLIRMMNIRKKDKTPEPELMKDDEGAVADVASSVALAEV
jgi:hypothetical protein